jgi:hypothetical protein
MFSSVGQEWEAEEERKTSKKCFLAGGNGEKLCVAHLTLFYYMMLA